MCKVCFKTICYFYVTVKMEISFNSYLLLGVLVLAIVSGALAVWKLIEWRQRCKKITSAFLAREAHLQVEIDQLRTRLEQVSLENQSHTLSQKKIEILSLLGEADDRDSTTPTLHARFLAVVEEQIGNSSLQIEDIGQKLNLSRVQLYRRLKADTGMTPNELLRTYRLARAARLLTTSDLTVAEIAYRVGFSSPSYFSRCFREQFDILPQDFRASQNNPQ